MHDANIINEENNQLELIHHHINCLITTWINIFLIILVVQVGAGYFQEIASNFPIPSVEYEDLYLSFCLKKFTKIKFMNENFYKYRQSGQTFGNILKFDNRIGKFRSFRVLKVYQLLKT